MSSFKMKEQRSKGQRSKGHRSKGHYSSEFSIPLFLTIQVRIFANQVRLISKTISRSNSFTIQIQNFAFQISQ